MVRKLYLRPIGIMPARQFADRESKPFVHSLAGGHLFFSSAEILLREGALTRRSGPLPLLNLADSELLLPGDQKQLDSLLNTLSRRRTAMAGSKRVQQQIMGIVNVTPDSFSDGGQFANAQEAIDHALRLEDEGASILDVGGESTRPGSDPVPLNEELQRIMPVLEGLDGRVNARISVDTRKADVMKRAIAAGAEIINDVSALSYDSRSLETIAASGVSVILMHALGDPKTMQQNPRYRDVLLDVYDYLSARVEVCLSAGIARDKIIVDPGIGFGKTLEHNLKLLAGLSLFHCLGTTVLLGASRKRFIGALTNEMAAQRRQYGSVAAALGGIAQGAHIVRVHDVRETRQAFDVWQAITEISMCVLLALVLQLGILLNINVV